MVTNLICGFPDLMTRSAACNAQDLQSNLSEGMKDWFFATFTGLNVSHGDQRAAVWDLCRKRQTILRVRKKKIPEIL